METYKNPRQNTTSNIRFCLRGSCSELMTGIGMLKMAKSATRLTPAMVYQMARKSMQRPSMVESQKAATGRHIIGRRKESIAVHEIMKARPHSVNFCMMSMAKIRRYCNRMETLTRQVAMLYTMIEV